MNKTLQYLVLSMLPLAAFAQDREMPLKIWSTWGVDFDIVKDVSFDLSSQYGFDVEPIELRYVQYSARIEYSPKAWRFDAGATLTSGIEEDEPNSLKYRYFTSLGRSDKLGILRFSNSLKFEWHDLQETKYRYRIIHSFSIRPKSNWIAPKIDLTPFFSTQLFYNLGGNAISQYDAEGVKLGKFTPDGLHRLRLRLGFTFEPFRFLKITCYGMEQREFNTIWSQRAHQNLNVRNPETGNITRRFQNYYVAGISGKIALSDLRKAIQKKRKTAHLGKGKRAGDLKLLDTPIH